jgi:hypothetical protein
MWVLRADWISTHLWRALGHEDNCVRSKQGTGGFVEEGDFQVGADSYFDNMPIISTSGTHSQLARANLYKGVILRD